MYYINLRLLEERYKFWWPVYVDVLDEFGCYVCVCVCVCVCVRVRVCLRVYHNVTWFGVNVDQGLPSIRHHIPSSSGKSL